MHFPCLNSGRYFIMVTVVNLVISDGFHISSRCKSLFNSKSNMLWQVPLKALQLECMMLTRRTK